MPVRPTLFEHWKQRSPRTRGDEGETMVWTSTMDWTITGDDGMDDMMVDSISVVVGGCEMILGMGVEELRVSNGPPHEEDVTVVSVTAAAAAHDVGGAEGADSTDVFDLFLGPAAFKKPRRRPENMDGSESVVVVVV